MSGWNKFLVAVDDTDSCERALHYLGKVAGCSVNLAITLLHIYPVPPPNYYVEGHVLPEWRRQNEAKAEIVFAKAIKMLSQYSISESRIDFLTRMAAGDTISKEILAIQKEGEFGTVVVGKRGVSKAEEFLFGSISNTVVRNSKGFAVWVIG
jgi:nucleotide-binding universal stress UspA family protein